MTDAPEASRRSFLGLVALLPCGAPALARSKSWPAAASMVGSVGPEIGRGVDASSVTTIKLDASGVADEFSKALDDRVQAILARSLEEVTQAETRLRHLVLASVSPKADASATAVVSPAAAVAPHSVVAASDRGAPAPRNISSPDLPAASSGVAGLSSETVGKSDSLIAALQAGGEFDCSRNAMTFRVAAASEIISKSVSTTSIPTT